MTYIMWASVISTLKDATKKMVFSHVRVLWVFRCSLNQRLYVAIHLRWCRHHATLRFSLKGFFFFFFLDITARAMVKDYQSTCIYNISCFPFSFNIHLASKVFRCLCIPKSWFSLHQVVAMITDMNGVN